MTALTPEEHFKVAQQQYTIFTTSVQEAQLTPLGAENAKILLMSSIKASGRPLQDVDPTKSLSAINENIDIGVMSAHMAHASALMLSSVNNRASEENKRALTADLLNAHKSMSSHLKGVQLSAPEGVPLTAMGKGIKYLSNELEGLLTKDVGLTKTEVAINAAAFYPPLDTPNTLLDITDAPVPYKKGIKRN